MNRVEAVLLAAMAAIGTALMVSLGLHPVPAVAAATGSVAVASLFTGDG